MPKLIYHDSDGKDKVLVLGAEPVLIGRATECHVQTQDAMVSRRHARIYWDGNYWIEDLGSSNGVYVGNDKVQKAPFRPGDTVTCGSLILRMMPDTTPRGTASMPPMNAPPRMTGMMAPAAGPPPAAPPPAGPPPAAPPPAASASYSTSRAEVQIGPNAVLRGAVAPPNATTGALGSLAEELRQERQRRVQAEAAVVDAAQRARDAEARAAELEAAAREATLLKRKLDQAQADLRRLRGGQPADEQTHDDGELQELRARVADLEAQLAAAVSAAGGAAARAAAAPSDAEARLQRQVEQLQAELRRARAGAAAPAPAPAPAAPAAPALAPEAAEAAVALGDSLAELRASLRAANDEAGLLTAPTESVAVIAEALRAAAEQLEAARDHLRTLGKHLGVR